MEGRRKLTNETSEGIRQRKKIRGRERITFYEMQKNGCMKIKQSPKLANLTSTDPDFEKMGSFN